MNITETERLTICKLEPADAAFIFELVNDPGWIRYIGDRGIRTLDDARAYIENGPMKSYALNGFGLYLVKLKSTAIPVGICGLIKRDTLDDVDIGYAFLPQYRAQGYAFESALAVLAYGQEAIGLSRIVAITTPDNAPSIRLLEKLGMRFEGMIKLTPAEADNNLYGINFQHS